MPPPSIPNRMTITPQKIVVSDALALGLNLPGSMAELLTLLMIPGIHG